ncbi:LPS-assembly lipoprotein [Nitrosomonas sp. PY1]|uniref:LPS-assembly lipoprotein LptE n=1 Tax=Nitrosomonas sp. PY1 TaxID=1803906 RepID=UPI001FC7DC4B|nr:LPS assembly lipoprotein LptE [Nitrosomonas sp. PY1]GKS69535.1 LPS-assembly lipoprotein [Nitrosomonas sp. PY1]
MDRKYNFQQHTGFISVFLIAVFILTACGFKLRGETVSLPFKSLYVLAPDGPGQIFGVHLERAIRTTPTTKVVMEPDNADAMIEIIGAVSEKSILSLSGGGRVRDFNVVYRVSYRVVNQQRIQIIPPTEILLARILPFLDEQIVAKGFEENLLIKDMQADAIQQILWRLSTYKPNPEEPTS